MLELLLHFIESRALSTADGVIPNATNNVQPPNEAHGQGVKRRETLTSALDRRVISPQGTRSIDGESTKG